jgi:hypothetical protein
MESFVDIDDIEDLVEEICERRSMDPSDYLKHEPEIRNEITIRMNEFKGIQEKRAHRFKLLYKALDEFDAPKIYNEIKRLHKKKYILKLLHNETEKLRALYKPGDKGWIRHKNYSDTFFGEYTGGGCCFESYSRTEILRTFALCFDLERYDSSDSD